MLQQIINAHTVLWTSSMWKGYKKSDLMKVGRMTIAEREDNITIVQRTEACEHWCRFLGLPYVITHRPPNTHAHSPRETTIYCLPTQGFYSFTWCCLKIVLRKDSMTKHLLPYTLTTKLYLQIELLLCR